MADSNTTLPNPFTPLAFLPPEIAYQTSVAIYVLAGGLGVLVWDLLDNIVSDYKLLFKTSISLTTLVYFASRIGSLGYVLSANIFETAPTGNCNAFEHIGDAWYPVSLSFSALLFFFRVRAIYNRNRIVVAFFFALWLALVGTTILIPIVISGATIGPTKYCVDADVPNSSYAAIFAPLIHDTLVFGAISYRLALNAHMDVPLKDGFKIALFGKYLPTFTQSLLKDGQRISLLSNLVTLVMIFNTRVPVAMRSMFATPNIALLNIMACRVYRNTKFGLFREEEISTTNMLQRNAESKLPPFPVFAHRSEITTCDSHTGNVVDLGSAGTLKNMRMTENEKEVEEEKVEEVKRYSVSLEDAESRV